MARTRTQSLAGNIGFRTSTPPGTNTYDPAWTQVSAVCVDDTGAGDHSLGIEKSTLLTTPLTGTANNGLGVTYTWNGKYLEVNNGVRNYPSSGLHLVLPSPLSTNQMATIVMNRTNPSRADVSIPNFVYELKDLPGMLHDIMALKLGLRNKLLQRDPEKFLANQYLSGVLGWRPFIGDLRKMMEFQSRVDRRVKELRHLYSSGGMRRSIKHGLDSASASYGVKNFNIFTSANATIKCNLSVMTHRESWATVRWTPTSVPKDLTDIQLQKLAFSLVFGLNIQPRYLWDALPWTWLIDWFTNIGDFLGSFSGVVPAVSSLPCIMTYTKTEAVLSRGNDVASGVAGGYGSFLRESKVRAVGGAALSASMPFLTARQMSILGALAVQRFKR